MALPLKERIIELVHRWPGLSVIEIMERLEVEGNAPAMFLSRMVKAGRLKRVVGPQRGHIKKGPLTTSYYYPPNIDPPETSNAILEEATKLRRRNTIPMEQQIYEAVQQQPGCYLRHVWLKMPKYSTMSISNYLRIMTNDNRLFRQRGPSGYQYWTVKYLEERKKKYDAEIVSKDVVSNGLPGSSIARHG